MRSSKTIRNFSKRPCGRNMDSASPLKCPVCRMTNRKRSRSSCSCLHTSLNAMQFSDYAILYRGNYQARIFETALRRDNIPYTISGGQSFFARSEIRDIISYLRLIANLDDDPAFIRAVTTPRRGVGQSTLETLGAFARSGSVPFSKRFSRAGSKPSLRQGS